MMDTKMYTKREKQRVLFIAFIWCCTFLFVMFQGGKLSVVLFLSSTLLSIYILSGRFSGIRRAQIHRQIVGNDHSRPILPAGSSIEVKVHVQLPGIWPVLYVLVRDHLYSERGEKLAFESSIVPNWKREGTLYYSSPPLKRGVYHFGNTICSTEDVFGIMEHQHRISIPQTLKVLPQMTPIQVWKIPQERGNGALHPFSAARMFKETSQMDGVRDYVYGDRLSRIHWNATARTRSWKSKEYEKESMPRVVFCLDQCRTSYLSSDQFELAVSVAASMIRYGYMHHHHYKLFMTESLPANVENNWFSRNRQEYYQFAMDQLIEARQGEKNAFSEWLETIPASLFHYGFVVVISARHDHQLEKALLSVRHDASAVCFIGIGNSNSMQQFRKRLEVQGVMSYSIDQLEQLPVVLGGSVS